MTAPRTTRRDSDRRPSPIPPGDPATRWFVLRDLKRPNALVPAFRMLADLGTEVFVPMTTRVIRRRGALVREQTPFIRDLLFAHSSRLSLDPVIARTPTLQYRFFRGGAYMQPLTVPDDDMDRFIRAVCASDSPVFLSPDEIPDCMLGAQVRIMGGPLDGVSGTLASVSGHSRRRLLVSIPGCIAVAVEVSPQFIQIL